MAGTPSPGTVCTKQARIAELAKQAPSLSFTTLAHHIDLRWLYEAFLRTRRDGATGVDGQTSMDYAADLRGNLATRLSRVGADGVTAVVAARAALDRLAWEPLVGMAVQTLDPRDGGKFFFFTDPDGNNWAVQEIRERIGTPLD